MKITYLCVTLKIKNSDRAWMSTWLQRKMPDMMTTWHLYEMLLARTQAILRTDPPGAQTRRYSNNNCIQRCNSRIFTISSLRHESSPTRNAQVAWAQLCANYMQHIERLSHATCCVTCHVVQRDSSSIKFYRVEFIFIWVSFLLVEPFNRWYTSMLLGC